MCTEYFEERKWTILQWSFSTHVQQVSLKWRAIPVTFIAPFVLIFSSPFRLTVCCIWLVVTWKDGSYYSGEEKRPQPPLHVFLEKRFIRIEHTDRDRWTVRWLKQVFWKKRGIPSRSQHRVSRNVFYFVQSVCICVLLMDCTLLIRPFSGWLWQKCNSN